MKLLDNLYSIELTGVDSFKAKLHSDSVIYQAHFPGQPITPGVCIVAMARDGVELLLGKKLETIAIKNVKFVNMVSPETTPEVECRISKMSIDGLTVKFQASIEAGGELYAKISMTCAELN